MPLYTIKVRLHASCGLLLRNLFYKRIYTGETCLEKGKFIPGPRISQRFVCKILRIFDNFVVYNYSYFYIDVWCS